MVRTRADPAQAPQRPKVMTSALETLAWNAHGPPGSLYQVWKYR